MKRACRGRQEGEKMAKNKKYPVIKINGHRVHKRLMIYDTQAKYPPENVDTDYGHIRSIYQPKGLWYFVKYHPEGIEILGSENMMLLFTEPIKVPAEAITFEDSGDVTIEIPEGAEELELQLSIFEELRRIYGKKLWYFDDMFADYIIKEFGGYEFTKRAQAAIQNGLVYTEMLETLAAPEWLIYRTLHLLMGGQMRHLFITSEERNAIVLYDTDGKYGDEIAEELAIDPETVKFYLLVRRQELSEDVAGICLLNEGKEKDGTFITVEGKRPQH